MKKIISKPPLPFVSSETVLKTLAEAGFTNSQIASAFGLSENQFNEILAHNPDVSYTLEEAKRSPNRAVEASLYKRALGYRVREVHKVEGKPIKVIEKELAPDVVADIFWLKNRDPKRWRDVIDMQFTLRDRLNRAHHALSEGRSPAQLENKGGNGGGEGAE